MSTMLSDLQSATLSLLNEASASSVAELPTGTGGSPTITTLTALTYYLNQAAALICRSCFPLTGVGFTTISGVTGATGTIDVLLAGLTVSAGESASGATGQVWAARGATWAGASLTHCSRATLELANPTWQSAAAGSAPLYWMENGQGNISLYPTIATGAATLAVAGLIIPVPLVNSSDTVGWLPDDLTHLLTKYAAGQVANKNFEDPSLSGRAPMYMAEFLDNCTRLWQRIPVDVRNAHFPIPPQMPPMQPGPQEGPG